MCVCVWSVEREGVPFPLPLTPLHASILKLGWKSSMLIGLERERECVENIGIFLLCWHLLASG